MKKKIQKLKDELDSILSVEPINSQEVLRISREIDKLLTEKEKRNLYRR